jgi:hypothetical protein
MESLFVTLYPGPTTIVNAQLLHVHVNRWDVRLSSGLGGAETMHATFWLDPAPVNCRVRIIDATEDLLTGELRASFNALDLDDEARKRITSALLGLNDYVRLRNVS